MRVSPDWLVFFPLVAVDSRKLGMVDVSVVLENLPCLCCCLVVADDVIDEGVAVAVVATVVVDVARCRRLRTLLLWVMECP